MANKLIKRRYNNLLTTRNNYFDTGGFWDNPFKGAGGMEVKKALTSVAGAAAGQIGGGLIGGGMQSGAGNVLQGLSGVAAFIPGPWGAVASAGLGVLGGLTNRMFGSKMNTGNIAKVEANINNLNNFQSNASDFDSLAQNWANADVGMTFSNSFIGKDGWFSNKAKNKAADLRRQIEVGNAWVQNSLNNNAENIGTTQMQNLLANYAAFGGELHTQGGDFTNGLIYVDEGGTHESNPYEGVMMGVDPEGTPNLVEEGEVVFNDYVFSNRMNVPKAVRNKYKLRGTKPLTYADAAKQMAKESEERPNDPISLNGLEAGLSVLMMALEKARLLKEANSFANGGNLYPDGGFKEAWKGWTNRQRTEFINYLKNKDATRFGNLSIGNIGLGSWAYDVFDTPDILDGFDASQYAPTTKYEYRPLEGLASTITEEDYLNYGLEPDSYLLLTPYVDDEGNTIKRVRLRNELDTPSKDNWLRYAPIVGSALGLGLSLFSKPDESSADAILEASRSATGEYSPVKFNPIGDYLTYRPLDRDYYLNLLNALTGATRRNVLNTSGGNRGTAMAGLLASDYNAINGVGDTLMKMDMYNREQEQKVAEFNRTTNTTNSQGFLQADMANQSARANIADVRLRGVMAAEELRQKAKLSRENAISANLTGLFNNIGAAGQQYVTNRWAQYYAKHGGATPEKRKFGGKIKRKGLTF